MRLSDIADWWTLRGHLREPWAFVRGRKAARDGPLDVELRDGGSIRLRPVPMDAHIFHRIFARDEYRLCGVAPGSWDTVIDVGAHIGIFAVRVAPLARRVLSYEPDRANFQLLVENVRRFSHVMPLCRAVAGRRGAAPLYVSDNPSAHSMHPATVDRRGATVSVECVPLAEVFEEHGVGHCDLLKLDCEGAEYDILYSQPEPPWPRIQRLALEYHPVAGSPGEWSGEPLALFLRTRGYRVTDLPSRKTPGKGHLFAVRP